MLLYPGSLKIACIYLIVDLSTGLIYIGQTRNLGKRLYKYEKILATVIPIDKVNEAWWVKLCKIRQGTADLYKDFNIDVLEVVSDPSMLDERERYWIRTMCATDRSIGMNIMPGGAGVKPIRNPYYRAVTDKGLPVIINPKIIYAYSTNTEEKELYFTGKSASVDLQLKSSATTFAANGSKAVDHYFYYYDDTKRRDVADKVVTKLEKRIEKKTNPKTKRKLIKKLLEYLEGLYSVELDIAKQHEMFGEIISFKYLNSICDLHDKYVKLHKKLKNAEEEPKYFVCDSTTTKIESYANIKQIHKCYGESTKTLENCLESGSPFQKTKFIFPADDKEREALYKKSKHNKAHRYEYTGCYIRLSKEAGIL